MAMTASSGAASSVQIHIRPVAGEWRARAGGAVIAQSAQGVEVIEGARAPVIYLPRGDVAVDLLERSDTVTTCPHKGQASYFHIITPSGRIADAIWSYEMPKQPLGAIAGMLAFAPAKVTLSRS